MKDLKTDDPRQHSKNIQSELQEISNHIRRDIEKVKGLQAKALFKTSAEVLNGLIKAYSHFEQKKENAWK